MRHYLIEEFALRELIKAKEDQVIGRRHSIYFQNFVKSLPANADRKTLYRRTVEEDEEAEDITTSAYGIEYKNILASEQFWLSKEQWEAQNKKLIASPDELPSYISISDVISFVERTRPWVAKITNIKAGFLVVQD
jgi:hypothetical protein